MDQRPFAGHYHKLKGGSGYLTKEAIVKALQYRTIGSAPEVIEIEKQGRAPGSCE